MYVCMNVCTCMYPHRRGGLVYQLIGSFTNEFLNFFILEQGCEFCQKIPKFSNASVKL